MRPKRQKLGSDSEYPRAKKIGRRKNQKHKPLLHHASRNTSPQPGTCSTARPIPGRRRVDWPVPGPCRPAAPPGQMLQQQRSGRLHSRLGKEKKVRNLAVSPWLVAHWPPAAAALRTGGWFGSLGVGGWLWVSVRERARQSFGRSVAGRWVMDGGSQPGRRLVNAGVRGLEGLSNRPAWLVG